MGASAKSRLPPTEAPAGAIDAPLVQALRRALAALPPVEGRRVRLCVGLSGGLDSVVLLHALCSVRDSDAHAFALAALHVHHGLSADADAWAQFCAALCQAWQVPFELRRVEVPRKSGEGLEGAARRLRYAEFAASGADWIALAQHRGDQAETVLLNLLRGAGVAGAAAMPEQRPGVAGGPGRWRPLLGEPRAVLLAHARAHGLSWIEDESNADTRLRRNCLRHEVFPRLAERFPGGEAALARAAQQFGEAEELLGELARIDAAALRLASGRIDVTGFGRLSPARARNLLRFLWREAGFRAPDHRWLEEALAQLMVCRPDAETCLSTRDGELRIYRGELYCLPPRPLPPQSLAWAGELELPWAGGRVRFLPQMPGGIAPECLAAASPRLCPRRGGERLQLSEQRPRRSVRNLLQENGVPPWERTRLPYLWLGDRLAWVGGLGVDASLSSASGYLPVWDEGAAGAV